MRKRGPGRRYRYEIAHTETTSLGGEIIRAQRFRTQYEIAQHFNISQSSVRRWINGGNVNRWKHAYVVSKIDEPAIEEIVAENVLIVPFQ